MKKTLVFISTAMLFSIGVFYSIRPTKWEGIETGMTFQQAIEIAGRPNGIFSEEKCVTSWRHGIWKMSVTLNTNADNLNGIVKSKSYSTVW